MKKLLFIFMLIPFFSFSQKSSLKTTHSDIFGDPVFIVTKDPFVEGTKYIYNHWKEGYLVINDSIFSHQKEMMFDQSNGDLIIKSKLKDGFGFVINDNTVTGFIIHDLDFSKKRIFKRLNKSNFKNLNSQPKFYEVIANLSKTNYLIKYTQKFIFDPNRSSGVAVNNDFSKEYKEKVTYFIKNKSGKYIKTKLSKKAVLKTLSDQKSKVKTFVTTNKIKFNKEHDVVKVLDYYHTL